MNIERENKIQKVINDQTNLQGQYDNLFRNYKRLSDAIIEGEYHGPLKGETEMCLNVIEYWKCLSEVCDEEAPLLRHKALARREMKKKGELEGLK